MASLHIHLSLWVICFTFLAWGFLCSFRTDTEKSHGLTIGVLPVSCKIAGIHIGSFNGIVPLKCNLMRRYSLTASAETAAQQIELDTNPRSWCDHQISIPHMARGSLQTFSIKSAPPQWRYRTKDQTKRFHSQRMHLHFNESMLSVTIPKDCIR